MPNIRLKGKSEVAEGTMAFYFERPTGFQFKAGQFVDFTLVNPPETDEEGNTRSFSIASAPYEDDLMIATRMRDTAFKRILKTLAAGSEIQMEGPFGGLTLHEDAKRPAVFLTGGIGVTPFRSIALQTTHERSPHLLWMFYSNRRPEDAAFLDELTKLQTEKSNFKLVSTMTNVAESRRHWNGETGYIDKQMLSKYIDELSGPIYYIAGPPAMVDGMTKLLSDAGVKATDIRSEEFFGY
jgi:ferredoxin-NADP reductase